jgi:hypothetical protein
VRGNPSPGSNISNSQAVADEEARRGLCELALQDGVEAASLVDVAVDAVLDLFGSISFNNV